MSEQYYDVHWVSTIGMAGSEKSTLTLSEAEMMVKERNRVNKYLAFHIEPTDRKPSPGMTPREATDFWNKRNRLMTDEQLERWKSGEPHDWDYIAPTLETVEDLWNHYR